MPTKRKLRSESYRLVQQEGEDDSLKDEKVCLEILSDLTGLPVKLLKDELLLQDIITSDNKIEMNDLRKAMCYYLHTTLRDSRSFT